MRLASLFSGIDGFGFAGEYMGWPTVLTCEINPVLNEFLKQQYPNAAHYTDIKQTDFSIYRGHIDILTGGFPCQPYSVSGKQLGTDDERHLWPEMLRAIREIQPTWVVGENVRGIISWNAGMVFDQVQTDLEAEGYEILPFLLPAAGVNAPHERYRTWFVAYSNSNRDKRGGYHCDWKNKKKEIRNKSNKPFTRFSNIQTLTNSTNTRIESVHKSTVQTNQFNNASNSTNSNQQWSGICKICKKGKIGRCCCKNDVTYSNSKRLQQFDNAGKSGKKRQFNRSILPFENWGDFPTQSPVCNGNDGVSTELLRSFIMDHCNGLLSEKEVNTILSKTISAARKETIKAGGNAVVWQVVLQIFLAIDKYQKNFNS